MFVLFPRQADIDITQREDPGDTQGESCPAETRRKHESVRKHIRAKRCVYVDCDDQQYGGHGLGLYGGLYTLDVGEPVANGSWHYVNGHGKHCYSGPTHRLYLNNNFTPNRDVCKGFLMSSKASESEAALALIKNVLFDFWIGDTPQRVLTVFATAGRRRRT